MGTTIRDVVVKLNIEQAQASLKAPDVSAATASVQAYHDAMMESVKASQDVWKKLQEEIGKTKKKTDEVKPPPEAAKMAEANLKIGESFKAAGEGAFTFARGVAFMTASTDADFQKGLQTIAKVQGAFDVFKGSIETLKGVYEATKAVSAANAALAASQAAVTVSSSSAATAMTAFWAAATGPVGWAIGAAAAVIGAVTAAFYLSIPAADDAKTAYEKASEAAMKFAKASKIITAMGKEDQTSGLKSLREQLVNATTQSDKLLEKMRLSSETYNRFLKVRADAQDPTSQARADARQLAAAKDLASYSNEYRANKTELLSIERQVADAEVKSLELQKSSLQAVREKLDLENARLKSLDAQFGMMSAMDRKELERLAKKQSGGGTLSREELMMLQKVGGSAVNPFVEDKFAEFGRKAGSREAYKAFGVDTGSKASRLGSEQDAILSALNVGTADEGEAQLANRIEEIMRNKAKSTEKIIGYLESLNLYEAKVEERIVKLEEEFKKRRK